MGGSSVRLVLCVALAGVFAVGCQPLYGGRPDKLKNPERKKKPEEPPEASIQIKYVEDCAASFRDDPKSVRPDTAKSNQLVGDGEEALAQVGKAKDPQSQAELIKVAIDKYRSALIKDPYNHEATLKLALAYDMVYRKGCALALLKRIAALEANPKFAPKAKRIADEVADNQAWFKGYRKDAVAAVGR